jgi:hypothetical protein
MISVSKKTEYTSEVKLYIGCREGYYGKEFTEDELVEAIGSFQSRYDESAPTRVTKTRYVDQTYSESGWEIGVVNYPRKPRTKAQLHRFATDLAVYLLETLKQQRITFMTEKYTTVFEVKKI